MKLFKKRKKDKPESVSARGAPEGKAKAKGVPKKGKGRKKQRLDPFGLGSKTIPVLVEECISFLEQEDRIMEEGIFRVSGDFGSMRGIYEAYGAGESGIDLLEASKGNMHVVAGVIKMFLREIPIPLLTFEFYDTFMECLKSKDEESLLFSIKTVINLLPVGNLLLLSRLIPFLNKVSLQEASNKMSSSNLAIVFGPSILRPLKESMEEQLLAGSKSVDLTRTIITHSAYLFASKESRENVEKQLREHAKENQEFMKTLKKGTLRLARNVAKEDKKEAKANVMSNSFFMSPEEMAKVTAEDDDSDDDDSGNEANDKLLSKAFGSSSGHTLVRKSVKVDPLSRQRSSSFGLEGDTIDRGRAYHSDRSDTEGSQSDREPSPDPYVIQPVNPVDYDLGDEDGDDDDQNMEDWFRDLAYGDLDVFITGVHPS